MTSSGGNWYVWLVGWAHPVRAVSYVQWFSLRLHHRNMLHFSILQISEILVWVWVISKGVPRRQLPAKGIFSFQLVQAESYLGHFSKINIEWGNLEQAIKFWCQTELCRSCESRFHQGGLNMKVNIKLSPYWHLIKWTNWAVLFWP